MTRIEWDGTMQRRMVNTAQRGDGPQWEDLTGRALAILPLYRPVPRAPVYHIRVDDTVVQAAEQDLTGPLLDLITAVLALGEELLPTLGAKRADHGQRSLLPVGSRTPTAALSRRRLHRPAALRHLLAVHGLGQGHAAVRGA
ncbi:MAG TPA: hypothetical protein VIV12_01355, partial [Streptosporangiaceae bacterium]